MLAVRRALIPTDHLARCCLLAAVCLLPACASLGEPLVKPKPETTASPKAASTAAVAAPAAEAYAAADFIIEAREAVAAAKQALPTWTGADFLLAKAEAADRNGNTPRARSLAKQVTSRAQAQRDTAALDQARMALAKARQRTGLNDVQLAALRTAELAIVRGQGVRALDLIERVETAASIATKLYTVQRGDSLWTIAAKPSVYGNAFLWPLIWRANLDLSKDPAVLRAGMDLDIRTHPSVDEVYSAVQEAQGRAAKVQVGPVKPAN